MSIDGNESDQEKKSENPNPSTEVTKIDLELDKEVVVDPASIDNNSESSEVSVKDLATEKVKKDEEELEIIDKDLEELFKDVPTRPTPEPEIGNKSSEISTPSRPKTPSINIPPIVETISMMNARVGEPYEQQIPLPEGFFISGYGNVEDPELHIDTIKCRITGTPSKAGTVEIELNLKSELGKSKIQKISFAVIPDPKSLWKDIPSKVDGPFWKMPLQSECITGDLEMLAASRRGRSHAHEGTNRDDDFAMLTLGIGNWHIAAVADGAGASKYSRRASQIAVNHAITRLPFLLAEKVDKLLPSIPKDVTNWDDAAKKPFRDALYNSLAASAFEAAKRLREEFVAAQATQRDFYTTLLLVATKRLNDGWFVSSFSVGDGGIGIFDQKLNQMTRMSHADGGAFAGETIFLTVDELSKPETINRVKFTVVKDFTAIVLMTDGVTDPYFPADNDLDDIERWNKFWNSITSECNLEFGNKTSGAELLNWLDFYMQGQNDDRTLAILRPIVKGA